MPAGGGQVVIPDPENILDADDLAVIAWAHVAISELLPAIFKASDRARQALRLYVGASYRHREEMTAADAELFLDASRVAALLGQLEVSRDLLDAEQILDEERLELGGYS
jgi:hypothetical protein